MTGKVKWFNDIRSFGFIAGDDGIDYFVHRSNIQREPPYLEEGETVEFDTAPGQKPDTFQAIAVEVVEGE